MSEVKQQTFEKYFTLEEAVGMLPYVRHTLALAHRQLEALRDEVIFSKRLMLARRESGRVTTDAEVAVLQKKFDGYQEAVQTWVDCFSAEGILLRDLEVGLVDFPYHAATVDADFFLCWRPPEDGIFYFHPVDTGYAGRHPITLLPD